MVRGQFTVEDPDLYEEAMEIIGDVPDEVFIEPTEDHPESDSKQMVQEIWAERSEGRMQQADEQTIQMLRGEGALRPVKGGWKKEE